MDTYKAYINSVIDDAMIRYENYPEYYISLKTTVFRELFYKNPRLYQCEYAAFWSMSSTGGINEKNTRVYCDESLSEEDFEVLVWFDPKLFMIIPKPTERMILIFLHRVNVYIVPDVNRNCETTLVSDSNIYSFIPELDGKEANDRIKMVIKRIKLLGLYA